MEELESIALSPAERSRISAASSESSFFSILGHLVRLTGNDAGIIERFCTLYEPFRVATPSAPPELTIEFHIEPDGAMLLIAPPDFFRVRHPEVIRWPSAVLASIILERIKTHYLVHAGCVARSGRAIIIAGASGMGKTTLSAHLAARGCDLLSDELAPIRRSDGRVDPYPLRVGIRPGPGRALVGEDEGIDVRFGSDEKKLLGVEALAGGRPPTCCNLYAVVFLTTDLDERVRTSSKSDGVMRAWFTEWPADLARAIESEFGARLEGARRSDDLVAVDIRLPNFASRIEELRATARRHGSMLAFFCYDDLGEIVRDMPPKLLPIPATAGVMELIKKIPGHLRVKFVESEFGGKASGLVADLSRLVQQVRFFKLSPGRLEASIELVEGLWR